MASEGQLDIQQDGLDLVHVEVLQLVRGRQHDGVLSEAVGTMEQVAGVQLEEPAQQRGVVWVVRARSRADGHRGRHHGAVGPDGQQRLDLALRDEQVRAVVTPLEGSAGGLEESLEILDGSRHGSGQEGTMQRSTVKH